MFISRPNNWWWLSATSLDGVNDSWQFYKRKAFRFFSVDGSIGLYKIRVHRCYSVTVLQCYSVRKYDVEQVYTSYQQQKISYKSTNYRHRNKTTPYHPFTTVYLLNSPFTTHPPKIPLFHSHNPGFLPLKSAFFPHENRIAYLTRAKLQLAILAKEGDDW